MSTLRSAMIMLSEHLQDIERKQDYVEKEDGSEVEEIAHDPFK